ncbi:MAG: hemolysin III family protein [Opitutales bacterium]|nr:hemolysin III family protein [Opitutales bacterium]
MASNKKYRFYAMGYSKREEFLNCISHIFAAVLSVAAGAYLICRAQHLGHFKVLSVFVFAATAVFAFASSALYHGANGKIKLKFKLLDHIAIFFMTFGVFFAAASLSSMPIFWTAALSFAMLFAAITGSIMKIKKGTDGTKRWSVLFYTIMPSAIIAPMFFMPPVSVLLFLIAAVFDLTGLFFYLKKNAEFAHAIWHIFSTLTIAGDFCAVYTLIELNA